LIQCALPWMKNHTTQFWAVWFFENCIIVIPQR
jgi:hypothetical protein